MTHVLREIYTRYDLDSFPFKIDLVWGNCVCVHIVKAMDFGLVAFESQLAFEDLPSVQDSMSLLKWAIGAHECFCHTTCVCLTTATKADVEFTATD